MNIIKTIFLILVFFTSVFAQPNWYYKIPINGITLVGYGSSKSEVEAKQNALKDIASQISVKIESTTEQNKSLKDGQYKKDIKTTSKQQINTTIEGYELLKIEKIRDTFYVALSYENISSIDKFIKKLKKETVKNEKQNTFIKQTNINNHIFKKTGLYVDFKLQRKDEKWYIKHNNIMQVLDNKDFARFFTTIPNKSVSINTNKRNNILYDGDEFYFKINSKKDSFVSILTVYEDGTVSTLVKNIHVDKNRVENIPDKDFEAIPQAGLLKNGVDTFDMYIVIQSNKKLIFDSLASADEDLIKDEKYKNFDELIEFLDGKTFSTLKVITKAR